MNCHKIDFFHPKCSHNHRKAVRRKLALNKILNYYLNNSPLFNSDTIPGTRNVIPTVRARGKNLPTPSFIGFPLMMAKYGFSNHAEKKCQNTYPIRNYNLNNFWYPHISLAIRNIKSIMERKNYS